MESQDRSVCVKTLGLAEKNAKISIHFKNYKIIFIFTSVMYKFSHALCRVLDLSLKIRMHTKSIVVNQTVFKLCFIWE